MNIPTPKEIMESPAAAVIMKMHRPSRVAQ